MHLIVDHLDIWTAAPVSKANGGRGRVSAANRSPYGIKKLRELILELAVRGRLVEQNPNDEPASVLLERIAKEKGRLIKEGKIKKQKPLPEISKEDKPFELPNGWLWVRLGDIGHDWGQKTPESDFTYIDVSAIDSNVGCVSSPNVLSASEAPSRARKIVQVGTVIYSTVRPYLRNISVIEHEYSPKPIASTAFAILHPFDRISGRFIAAYLRSPVFIHYIESVQTGIAYPAINDRQFWSGLISLPPLAEQHRIVAKVDELMALCDRLEQQQGDSSATRQALVETLLATLTTAADHQEFAEAWHRIAGHFDTLFTTEESIDQLKQTILQLAVQGKLVPQDPNDEPASVLLEKINSKNVGAISKKRGKRVPELSPVDLSNIPYEVPDSWVWSRFGDVAVIASNLVKPEKYRDAIHVAPDNIEKGTGKLFPCRTVEEDKVRSSNHHFYSGQILYSKIRPNLSKATIVNFDGLCSADMYPIASYIDSRFLLKYILSDTFLSMAVKNDTRVAMPKINQEELNQILVAVPPLAEQHRIVAKVDELMALCDQLKATLTQSQQQSEKLIDVMFQQLLVA
jgi:type I restriction enzyme S subunit